MAPAIKRFITGPIETNTYVVSGDDRCALVIDPSSDCGEVVAYLAAAKLSPAAIVLTHGHFDHLLGIPQLQSSYPALPVFVHPDDKVLLTHSEYNGSGMLGMEFSFGGPTQDLVEGPACIGGLAFAVLHVPGHSPGGCAFVFEGGNCISGDTLFEGSIGRYDFPGCDGDLLVKGIKAKLLTLPAQTIVHPGHGETTTVGRERRWNPFLQ